MTIIIFNYFIDNFFHVLHFETLFFQFMVQATNKLKIPMIAFYLEVSIFLHTLAIVVLIGTDLPHEKK